MSIGVYKITNIINNKFYIGSSRRLNERKNEHKYKLKQGKGNSIIRNAVIKYGYENFKFEILEEFVFQDFASPTYIDELITSREQYYVDILKPQYNIKIKDVCDSKGIPRNILNNTSEILSKREIRRRSVDKQKKYIDVYDLKTLTFIETIYGLRKCALKYNITSSQLSKICIKGVTELYKREHVFCFHNDNINNKLKTK